MNGEKCKRKFTKMLLHPENFLLTATRHCHPLNVLVTAARAGRPERLSMRGIGFFLRGGDRCRMAAAGALDPDWRKAGSSFARPDGRGRLSLHKFVIGIGKSRTSLRDYTRITITRGWLCLGGCVKLRVMKKQASDQSFHDRRYQERKRAEAAKKAVKKKVVSESATERSAPAK